MKAAILVLTPPEPMTDGEFYAVKFAQYILDGLPNVMADAFEDALGADAKSDDHDLIREVFRYAGEEMPTLAEALEVFDAVVIDTWSFPSEKLERFAAISEKLHGKESDAARDIRKDLAAVKENEAHKAKEDAEAQAIRDKQAAERREAARQAKGLELLAKLPGEMNQAYADWLSNRAYIDGNGNYHIGKRRYGGHLGKGPIAPWNKTVKRAYKDSGELHKAAHAALQPFLSSADVDKDVAHV